MTGRRDESGDDVEAAPETEDACGGALGRSRDRSAKNDGSSKSKASPSEAPYRCGLLRRLWDAGCGPFGFVSYPTKGVEISAMAGFGRCLQPDEIHRLSLFNNSFTKGDYCCSDLHDVAA